MNNIDNTQQRFPFVGVVTPVRNRRAWSVGFVQRFTQQDYPYFKLYVVDSASTDGTPEAIRAFGRDEVEVLDAPASAYWTAATNIGVKRALADNCEYILTINDDAIVLSDFLSTMVRAAQDGGALVVGAVINYAGEPARLWGVGAYNDFASGAFVQTGLANMPEEVLLRDSQPSQGLRRVDYLCGNGTLIHRSVFDEVGLYDERNTPHYHADTEFTMRVERAEIGRYCALNARLYNRFTEANDGAFANKNVQFFSMRSANYVRPLLYILNEYCRFENRVLAFVRYFGRYMPGASDRDLSKILRAIEYLANPKSEALIPGRFIPPPDFDLRLAQDLDLLLATSVRGFAAGAYARLLRRPCDDMELANQENAAAAGKSRLELLSQIINSDEYKHRVGDQVQKFADALLYARAVPTLSNKQVALIAFRQKEGRNPNSGEYRKLTESVIIREDVPTVYFNVDVPCMAISDHKAQTGVHRYVTSILDALLVDARIRVKLFYSPELHQQFERLMIERPRWRQLSVLTEDLVEQRGVAFYPYFPLSARPAALRDLPQLQTLCDLYPLTNPEWFTSDAVSRFRRQLHGLINVDHIFCISRATELELHRVFPVLTASSSVTHLAANAFNTPQPKFGALAKAIKNAFRSPYFVCVGTIEPRKNLRSVLAAFARLNRDEPELRMAVVGQQGWEVSLDELLNAETGLNRDRVEFHGRVPDERLRELYAGAVCVAFPSLGEGFGLPILEAFECGTPVVTSNVASMPEIATKGAILVNPTDPIEIANAIRRLKRDQGLRAKLAKEALERAREFSWQRCANDHIEIFLKLIGNRPEASWVKKSKKTIAT